MNNLFQIEGPHLTDAKRFIQDLRNSKSMAGNSWDTGHMEQFVAGWLKTYGKPDKGKRAPKASILEESGAIYQAYPRKVAPEAAKRAISGILRDGKTTADHLLTQTQHFARCVAHWPSSYRKLSDGGDRCPHPATWFNRGSWSDDPKEWYGPSGQPNEIVRYQSPVRVPDGWQTWMQQRQAEHEQQGGGSTTATYAISCDNFQLCPESWKTACIAQLVSMKIGQNMRIPAQPQSMPSLAFPDR